MSGRNPGPAKTCVAAAAIAAFVRVKYSSGSGEELVVTTAGAGEQSISVSKEAASAAGDPISIDLNSGGKTMLVTTDGAYAAGTEVYGVASGKVGTTGTPGAKAWILLQPSTADGSQVEAKFNRPEA